MSATTAPTVTLNVTELAATEIRKFMSGEEGLPETSGLRVRVVPGGCSGFQYSLNIEEQSRRRFHSRRKRRANVRRHVQRAVSQRSRDRLREWSDGLGLHVQEPECHRQLRMRYFVHRITDCTIKFLRETGAILSPVSFRQD